MNILNIGSCQVNPLGKRERFAGAFIESRLDVNLITRLSVEGDVGGGHTPSQQVIVDQFFNGERVVYGDLNLCHPQKGKANQCIEKAEALKEVHILWFKKVVKIG